MKKICFLFVLLLAFSGCSRETMDMTPEKAAEVALTEYGENTGFVRADEDFLTTNFGSRDYVRESAVYFSENGDGNEHTQKEVADLLGISQSYISRLEKKIMKRLRKEMMIA
jgi:hypothetical protein